MRRAGEGNEFKKQAWVRPIGLALGGAVALSACSVDIHVQGKRSPSSSTVATGGARTPESPHGGSGPWSEKQQFDAPSFRSWRGPTGVGPRVAIGETVKVDCRVPGTDDMPASVKQGGWYRTEELGGQKGPFFVAANTFENGPMPNNNPYDPNVEPCTQAQLGALLLHGTDPSATIHSLPVYNGLQPEIGEPLRQVAA